MLRPIAVPFFLTLFAAVLIISIADRGSQAADEPKVIVEKITTVDEEAAGKKAADKKAADQKKAEDNKKADEIKKKAYDDPAKVDDPDFKLQGEYVGEASARDEKMNVGIQVIALGGGKFRAVLHPGGLPGDGWDPAKKKRESEATLKDGEIRFDLPQGSVLLKDGAMSMFDSGNAKVATLKRVERQSPTLGAKPPEGATVLFDGKNADAWEKGRMTEDGLLMQGVTSKEKFGDVSLHIEFRLPYQPYARGQGRGNSGIYLQGRYEVQMLDSFGLEGKDNECGGLYTIKDPSVNMCYPPLAWQTYDIDYSPANYKEGKKVANATITVRHNGVLIHEKVELSNSTTSAPGKEGPENGPVFLQDHGNPVRYRNIWVMKK